MKNVVKCTSYSEKMKNLGNTPKNLDSFHNKYHSVGREIRTWDCSRMETHTTSWLEPHQSIIPMES